MKQTHTNVKPPILPIIHVIGDDPLTNKLFYNKGFITTLSPKVADILVWTGGSDVNTQYYGENPIPECGQPNINRDDKEKDLFHQYYNKPSIGICRGGQFLNVMNKGKLWQHVDGHGIAPPNGHILFNKWFPQGIAVTSTHHQMMIPNTNVGGEVIGWAYETTILKKQKETRRHQRKIPQNPIDNNAYKDCEIVWYPKSQSLCFQPHPEYGLTSCRNLFFFLLEKFIMQNHTNN